MPRTNWFEKSIAALKAPVMFSCHAMTRLISRAQDDMLPGFVRGKMRLHFLTCAGCRRYAEQLGFLRGALHRLSESAEGIPAQPLPLQARARMKQMLREQSQTTLPAESAVVNIAPDADAAAAAEKVVAFPVPHRSQWTRVLQLAAAVAVFAGLAGWWLRESQRTPFAAVPERIIEFFATKQKVDPAPQSKDELRTLLVQRGAPANLRIPASLQPLENAACQVVDVQGQKVYLASFWRVAGERRGLPELVHLVVARRGDFRDPPAAKQPRFSEHDGWSFASWSEGDIIYTLAAAAPPDTLRQFVSFAPLRSYAASGFRIVLADITRADLISSR